VNDLHLDHIEHADAISYLRTLPDGCVNCVVTSPPYFGLRDYGTATWDGGDPACDHVNNAGATKKFGNPEFNENRPSREETKTAGYYAPVCPKCGAIRIDSQIGLEPTPGEYVAALVAVFAEVKRVLRDDGVVWLNLGDSYSTGKAGRTDHGTNDPTSTLGPNHAGLPNGTQPGPVIPRKTEGYAPKSLLGIPWRVAFGLQDDGWTLRADIIWCLSGGAWVYARTQKGDMPMMVRDMFRLDPSTVKLWNGQKWTQVLGMTRTPREGEELELVLRSGERISCTPNHEWPTQRGLLRADQLVAGDVLETCTLPEPDEPLTPANIGTDAAWFVGLYIAEGSRSGHTIQIAGHAKEEARWERVQAIAKSYGGSATRTIKGNMMHIRVYGAMLHTLIDQFVSGRVASDKALNPIIWRYSNEWLRALLDGYLSGDGHYDAKNDRWRIGFTRNYSLERDIRILAARLGFTLTLKPSNASIGGHVYPSFRGEIRFGRNSHHNERPRSEVVEIRNARCREVYDIGVADEPHLFALASGVLTHNSKPNPMPESVTDRPTRSHEYIFLLAKGPKYWYDAAAVSEPTLDVSLARAMRGTGGDNKNVDGAPGQNKHSVHQPRKHGEGYPINTTRNRRTVWTITPANYADAHFATFPEAIPEICIKAGCPEGGVVLDIFMGAGTTALVAKKLNRRYLGCDLNADYVRMAIDRVDGISYTLFSLMEVTGD
jgi:DNA modification methylase